MVFAISTAESRLESLTPASQKKPCLITQELHRNSKIDVVRQGAITRKLLIFQYFNWCWHPGSNWGPTDYKCD